MRVGIDIQVVAAGNRTGLYSHLRSTVRELRPLVDHLTLFAEAIRPVSRGDGPAVSKLMDGARVRIVQQPPILYRLWREWSEWNRMDVFLHNLHGVIPRTTKAANAYLVPDVIPLAVDYGIPGFVDRYRPFYEDAAKYGDVVLVSSEHGKHDFLTRVGGDAERVRVAPLAAGSEFQPRHDAVRVRQALAPLGLADVPYVLNVATIEVKKNHLVLVRAFAEMLRKDPSIPHKLLFVGGKWVGHEAVFDLIRTLGLEDRVVYAGFVDDLPPVYGGADAFVFPSLYEGFGLPPLEAMASGVPVLAADATSLPEVVGDAGILFPPHDVMGLCDALHRVLTDRAYHDELVARGIARAATFSWQRTAALYRDALEIAVQRRRSA